MNTYLTDFQIIRPAHEISQEKSLRWIAKAHATAEAILQSGSSDPISPLFLEEIENRLLKLGLGVDKILKRGSVLRDIFHENWHEMSVYNLHLCPQGVDFGARSALFGTIVESLFEQFYPESHTFPEHLIHVTCTGYVAPSGAQKIVAKRNASTSVTHAYHMGCYASLPAIRMAQGFANDSVDIVHTELCTLHMNPAKHTQEQLVAYTLFADGFIKYTLIKGEKKGTFAFLILALHEEIIPNSASSMGWICEGWGMRMILSKEIPVLIKRNLRAFLQKLCKKANIDLDLLLKEALFAIHPGGTKIIQQIAQELSLKKEQIQDSQFILENYGNMSSATLPHVWYEIGKSQPIGKYVVSIAAGPGLTLSGGIFQLC